VTEPPPLLLDVYHRFYERYGPQGWWPGEGAFETIVGAILTQNTSWSNVEKALAVMKEARVWSFPALRKTPEPELAQLVRSSGYFNAKAKKLKAMAAYMAGYEDEVAHWRTRDSKELRSELLAVHGVGPETADDIVLYVAHLPSFVIDTYTRRIVNRLGLEPERATYEGYQDLFEANLPAEAALFNEYHALLDAHAKETCLKREPRCRGCCLLDLCPTGLRASVSGAVDEPRGSHEEMPNAGPRFSARRA
jgi:endonuclease-3 related protein